MRLCSTEQIMLNCKYFCEELFRPRAKAEKSSLKQSIDGRLTQHTGVVSVCACACLWYFGVSHTTVPAFQPLNYPHSVYVCMHFCTPGQCSKATYFGILLLQGITKEDKRDSVAGYIQVAPRAINTFTSL